MAVRERFRRPQFGVGSVLARSFPIWLRNVVPFTILSLIVYSPYIAWTYFMPGDEDMAAVVARMLSLVLPLILTGAIIFGVFQHLRGQPAGILRSVGVGLRRLLPVLGTAILVSVIVGIFFVPMILIPMAGILLVFPAVYLNCMLWVAVPAAVIEKTGPYASLNRSSILTKGNKGTIFLILLVLGLMQMALGLLVGVAFSESAETAYWVAFLIAMGLGALVAVANCVAYHDLRAAKEGVGIEDLVAVFE